jgi:hypothetical protein
MNDYLFFLVGFVLVAVVEFFILLRWQHRHGLVACIILGALFSGILSTILSWAFSYLEIRSDSFAMRESPPTVSDYFMYAFFFVVWVFIWSGIALVPAGLTAFIYRRFRKQV